jgi:hypothetical protein
MVAGRYERRMRSMVGRDGREADGLAHEILGSKYNTLSLKNISDTPQKIFCPDRYVSRFLEIT